MAIIGISGKKQHGKDTVAKIIQYLVFLEKFPNTTWSQQDILTSNEAEKLIDNWQIKKFADKLKDIVCLLINCIREQLEDNNFKEKELGEEWDKDLEYTYLYPDRPKEKMTPRKLLQLLGTECGRQTIHPNIWVNALMSEYKTIGYGIKEEGEWATGHTDVRITPNWIITDVRFPNEVKAIEDKGGIVIRVNNPRIESTDTHESETALDTRLWSYYYNIYNDSTIEGLVTKVEEILKYHKII